MDTLRTLESWGQLLNESHSLAHLAWLPKVTTYLLGVWLQSRVLRFALQEAKNFRGNNPWPWPPGPCQQLPGPRTKKQEGQRRLASLVGHQSPAWTCRLALQHTACSSRVWPQ